MFTYKISEIKFSSGQPIDTHSADVILIVGPNNSGKSRTLQEIGRQLQGNIQNRLVTSNIQIQQEGSRDDLINWLSKFYPIITPSESNKNPYVHVNSASGKYHQLFLRENSTLPKQDHDMLTKLRILSNLLLEGKWLTDSCETKNIHLFKEGVAHPIHILQKSLVSGAPQIIDEFSQAVFDAFGFHVIPQLPFGRQSTIKLKKGKEPENIVDRYSQEYVNAIDDLPNLTDEGSGVKAYIGILQNTIIGQHKIVLIDEPELFLHPPQARRLGETVARHATVNGQQIIAVTHSSDFVIGAVTGCKNVCIIRIERDDKTNYISFIKPQDLSQLWNDPLLKSARALRGLFHDGVIVCEGDSDVRFYESILRRLESKRDKPLDIYFVHGGGKQRIKSLVTAYKQLNVPVVTISDFDLLRRKDDVEVLYEELGGDFNNIQGKYNSASNVLAKAGNIKAPIDAINEVRQYLNNLEDKVSKGDKISGGDVDKVNISKVMESARDWSNAKKLGIRCVKGGAKASVKDLLVELEKLGLLIAEFGELESWNDDIVALDKNDWLLQALEIINKDQNSFVEAELFMEKVLNQLASSKK
ncbi:MAG: TOPRIM nucleotidyl transferase/hydrolase domain-containing protein [Chloroflexota bacterium]